MATVRTNHKSRLISYMLTEGCLERDLMLIDVGCSQGIDESWRQFEPKLSAVGFDPLVPEVNRLNNVENNSKVRYVEGYVVSDRELVSGKEDFTSNWYERSSCYISINAKDGSDNV